MRQVWHAFGRFLLAGLILNCIHSPLFAASIAAMPELKLSVIHFRLTEDLLVIVPVTINGKGPYEFAFDTGSSRTLIDDGLAREVGLETSLSGLITTITHPMKTRLSVVREMRLDSAVVTGLEVNIGRLSGLGSIHGHVRGILGEDFCSHFDFLLDNRNRELVFEQPEFNVLHSMRGRASAREPARPGQRTVSPEPADCADSEPRTGVEAGLPA